jgi:hypothetical protein
MRVFTVTQNWGVASRLEFAMFCVIAGAQLACSFIAAQSPRTGTVVDENGKPVAARAVRSLA